MSAGAPPPLILTVAKRCAGMQGQFLKFLGRRLGGPADQSPRVILVPMLRSSDPGSAPAAGRCKEKVDTAGRARETAFLEIGLPIYLAGARIYRSCADLLWPAHGFIAPARIYCGRRRINKHLFGLKATRSLALQWLSGGRKGGKERGRSSFFKRNILLK